MSELPPPEIYADRPMDEYLAIIGRYMIMKELRLGFTELRMFKIARNEMKGYAFWGAMHKTWSGLHGDGHGLHLADVENAAMMLDVYDEVFKYRDVA